MGAKEAAKRLPKKRQNIAALIKDGDAA